MSEQQKILKALIICSPESREEGIISEIEAVIRDRFKSRVLATSNLEDLGSTFFFLMPHFIVLDPSYSKAAELFTEKKEYLEKIKKTPFIVISYPGQSREDISRFSISDVTGLSHEADQDAVTAVVEEMAKKAGFKVTGGKVFERLVTRPVNISIDVENYGRKLTGLTTGINRNGLGARIHSGGRSFSDLFDLSGRRCRVAFNEPDMWLPPIEGRLLRVEESSESGFIAFLAIEFSKNHFDRKELEILSGAIKNQHDENIIKDIPGPEGRDG